MKHEAAMLQIIDRALFSANRGILGCTTRKIGEPKVRGRDEDCGEFDVQNLLELFQAIASDVMGEVL